MTALRRVRAEAGAEWRSFLRRRTAVFFTFVFPLLLVTIFGVLVQTDPGGGGLFGRPAGYYTAGYLAVVVLFTPLSRVGSTIARHREGHRFEKLATTPLTRAEWLAAHTAVNTAIILVAAGIVLGVLLGLGSGDVTPSPWLLPLVALGVVVFSGIGAFVGRVAGSQDGVIAASNAIALPLVFLSETFVPPAMLPAWFRPAVAASPLTYFARAARAVTYLDRGPGLDLVVLAAIAVACFAVGTAAIPRGGS